MDITTIDEKYTWKVLGSHFSKYGLVHHQIDSFDDYINRGIQGVIDEDPDIVVIPKKGQKHVTHFGAIYVGAPSIIEEDRVVKNILPSEARDRDLTYESPIYCDISETTYEDDVVIEEIVNLRVLIGRTPVMVKTDLCNLSKLSKEDQIKSGECEFDQGGYFIIKGNERVLVAQIRGNHNQVIVLKQKPGEKYSYIADIRSMSEETGHSVKVSAMFGIDDRTLTFSLPYIGKDIHVGIVFKALGFLKDEEIANLIGMDSDKALKYIRFIIRDSFFIKTQEQALKYIGQYSVHIIPKEKKISYATQVVETELFPHLGVSATVLEKGIFLGFLLRKLISTKLGMRAQDDRDNYASKRTESSGILCTELYRTLFKRFISTIKLQLEKKKTRLDALSIITKTNCISQGLRVAFSTGNWGVQKNAYIRTGVSQVMSRMTYGSTLSHCRRLIIPIGKEGKNSKIRQIHSSQIGMICPAECFDPNTPIRMWAGCCKLAKYIEVGDILIDDSGNPTRVRSTCYGDKRMYEIRQNDGITYTVTDNHILTLKIRRHGKVSYVKNKNKYEVKKFDKILCYYTRKYFKTELKAIEYSKTLDDDILDITIRNYLILDENIKKQLYGFKCSGVNWPRKDVDIDPYIMGKWLVGNMEDIPDAFKTVLRKYDFYSIPVDFIINDRDTRLKLLAGFIDSIGTISSREIAIGFPKPMQAIEEKMLRYISILAGSLGFLCKQSLNDDLIITGNLCDIPSVLQCDRPDNTFLQTPIQVIEKNIGPFVGWQLEGNGRFLLGDFTVVHNTPEGQTAGIVMNFALLTRITRKIPTVLLKEVVEKSKYIISANALKLSSIKSSTYVLVNGILLGMTEDPDSLVGEMRILRKARRIDKEVSITYDPVDEEVRIFCDAGRLIRPFFSIDKTTNSLVIKNTDNPEWANLVKDGQIEYLDSSEIESYVIAMVPDDLKKWHNDYCEIHPSMMLGVMASIIPFPDHCPSPRNCISEGSYISCANGWRIPIEKMTTLPKLLTYDTKDKGLTSATPTAFIDNNTRECVEIIVEDGSKLKCTPDHRLLVQKDDGTTEWVKASDTMGRYLVSSPVAYPKIISVSANDKDWTLKLYDGSSLSIDKAIPFARLLGYILTNGSSTVYLGHELDVASFAEDIELFCEKSNITKQNNTYAVNIPAKLCSMITKLPGVQLDKPTSLPEFIFIAPAVVKQAFLCGLFGGDGTVNDIQGIGFCQIEYTDSSVKYMKDIKQLLIDCMIPSDSIHIGGGKFGMILDISRSGYDNIGFAYCVNKQIRHGAIEMLHRSRQDSTDQKGIEWMKRVGIFELVKDGNQVKNVLPTVRLRVLEIKNIGKKHVYDFTVPPYSSFVAENIVVHNCYVSSMAKQALGIYALSYQRRTDTIVHVMSSLQKPLVSTRVSRFMNFSEMPSGVNAIVAILSYTGLTSC